MSHKAELTYDDRRLAQVAAEFGLRLIVLYGSHAHSHPPPGPDSDVDVAVLGCSEQHLLKCYTALAPALNHGPLDLVRLEDADPLFRQEIMSRGVLLHGDPDLFCEYRAYAYRDFVDSADLRALEDTLFHKRMARIRKQLDASP